MTQGFIPPHGGYANLLSFRKAEIAYDATVCFCDRFLDRRDRTRDQMVQAARSGKQNIIEGCQVSGTSKEAEVKLTNVARASLEELLADYRDFLRVRGMNLWEKDSKEAVFVRRLGTKPDVSYESYRTYLETRPPGSCSQHSHLPHPSNQLPSRPADQAVGKRLSGKGRPPRTHDPGAPPGTPQTRETRRLIRQQTLSPFPCLLPRIPPFVSSVPYALFFPCPPIRPISPICPTPPIAYTPALLSGGSARPGKGLSGEYLRPRR